MIESRLSFFKKEVDVEITLEYKKEKECVECKVRNKKDVLLQKFDTYFNVDIERLFIGP